MAISLNFGALKPWVRTRVGPCLQRIAFDTGLMGYTRRRSSGGAIALMYHSVADASHARWIDPRNHVPADVFTQQMEFVAEKRNVVSLDELIRILESGEAIADGTMIITFDDGYLDNLTVAAPVLKSLGLPATLFVPTGYIDRGETQWVDQAYTAFRRRSRDVLSWGENPEQFRLDRKREYQSAYQMVCRDLLQACADHRGRLLSRLFEAQL